jgi:hypothetical protein
MTAKCISKSGDFSDTISCLGTFGLTHGELVMAVLTAIYVAITGFYAWVSHKTLDAIRKQAKDQAQSGDEQLRISREAAIAAKQSADAALLNAQALITSERPWIVVRLRTPRSGLFSFEAINYGRTPAEVIAIPATFTIDTEDNLRKNEPPYPTSILAYHKLLLPMSDLSDHPDFINLYTMDMAPYLNVNDRISQQIADTTLRLFVVGRVVYKDVLTRSEHETRFCYWYNPAGGGMLLGGPTDWNKYT